MTITLPNHFRNLLRRIVGLSVGRYFIVLNVKASAVNYSVKRIGPVEAGSIPSLEALSPGRYVTVLTVTTNGIEDHTIQRIGKVEK